MLTLHDHKCTADQIIVHVVTNTMTLKTKRCRCHLKIRSNFQMNIACYWTLLIRSFVVPSIKAVFDMVRGGRHKTEDPSASWRRNTSCTCAHDTLFIVWHFLFQKDKPNHSLSWAETWPMLGWEDVFLGTVRNFACWAEKKCSNIEENIVNNLLTRPGSCWPRNENLWMKLCLDTTVVFE